MGNTFLRQPPNTGTPARTALCVRPLNGDARLRVSPSRSRRSTYVEELQ